MPLSRSLTSATASLRLLSSATAALTSMRRELFSCLMMLIVGLTRTSATSAKRTREPLGVSIGRLRMSVRLRRALGVLQTCTSYALPPLKMSPTSSLDTSAEAARRTSPGLSP